MDLTPGKVKAPHGNKLNCKGWTQEAALRMIMNNIDAEVAEKPEELIVYGGTGKAARNQRCLEQIVRNLQKLENDETLLVQSGKAVGIVKTHADAPRVLIANSNLVPKYASWENFWELEKKGLIMYGQMTAGSWIYIGTQGILQGTYETLAEAARQHFGASLKGKIVLSAGLGGMGGAQPLAVTMNEGIFLGVEVDGTRIEKRLRSGYCEVMTEDLEQAVGLCEEARKKGEPLSVGLVGNAAEVLPALLKRGFKPDLVTDQTSAHDPLNGYVPAGLSLDQAAKLRISDPQTYVKRAISSMADHVRAMLGYHQQGIPTFDYGNNIRAMAQKGGVENAFDFPGFVPAYVRPLFCQGKGPFRWAAISGDPKDIAVTDATIKELFPQDQALARWLTLAAEKVKFQGLPCRICWLGYGERAKAGLAFNDLVASGKVSAPIVIGRDHLDCGSVASPNRETEAMKDGSDAIADWPVLNALLNAVNGASWVSYHHGGGVGIGNSLHAGMVIVADGTKEAAIRLQRVLTADPASGVIRHADAGYQTAIKIGQEAGLLPRE